MDLTIELKYLQNENLVLNETVLLIKTLRHSIFITNIAHRDFSLKWTSRKGLVKVTTKYLCLCITSTSTFPRVIGLMM